MMAIAFDNQKWLDALRDCQHIILQPDTHKPIELPEVYLWRPDQINEIAGMLR